MINHRKIQHLEALLQDPDIERGGSGFERIRLTHRALPQLNYDEIDTSTVFLNKRLSFPLLISSMTGGNDPLINMINRNLAIAAGRCGVALAVGSQRVMFADDGAWDSFDLRHYASYQTLLMANLGAVQLNKGFGIDEALKAVEVLEADALFFHLNPLQEAVQYEGDVDFSGLAQKIGAIQKALHVPIVLKEVGAGLSVADIELGYSAGIKFFDIAGRGGTSWSRLEAHRNRENYADLYEYDSDYDLGYVFQDWGIPTAEALHRAVTAYPNGQFIASGGIRNGIDMAKAIILGAQICGSAMPFLEPAKFSADAVITVIERWKREFQTAMFLLSCPTVEALRYNKQLIL